MLAEEIVALPERLNNKAVFSLSMALGGLPEARRYIFDFSRLDRAFPFSILLAAAAIRQFRASRARDAQGGWAPSFDLEGVDLSGNSAHGYLAHVGFFRHAGFEVGRLPGEAPGGASYVPITAVRRVDVDAEAQLKSRPAGEIVVGHAERLATVIAGGSGLDLHEIDSSQLFRMSAYCVREIIRNALEHSGAPEVMVCGQYYKTLNTVEIGILDEGIGIDRSLAHLHPVRDIRFALELAVKPGVSGVSAEEAAKAGKWGNSGFGLYTTSSLCTAHAKGAFCLASNGLALSIQRDGQYFNKVSFAGTAVMIKLYFKRDLSYDSLLDQYIDDGEKYAGIIRKSPSASKMTRVY